jgi:germination protein, Ger(x)C family
MKSVKSLILLLFIIILIPCSLCGCWDKKELNELAIVLGVGIDKAKTSNDIEMTVQIEKNGGSQSSSSSSSTGNQSNGSNYFNVKDIGKNVATIFGDYSHQLSRKMYIAQNQVIVFGEGMAKEGIRNSMDYFLRNYQGRLNVDVFVAKGRAGDILALNPTMGNIPAFEISQLIDAQVANSESTKLNVADLMTDLASSTKSMVAPYLDIMNDEGEKHFAISGSAVFKGDKLVGELDKNETRGYLWVINKVENGKITVAVLNEQAVLQISKAESQIVPVIKEDGSILIKVNVTEEGILSSQTGSVSLGTPENMKLLENAEVNTIKAEILRTLNKTREMGTDIYGFGESIKCRYPKQWNSIEANWNKLYKKTDVQITVTAKLRGNGRIVGPDYPEKEMKK